MDLLDGFMMEHGTIYDFLTFFGPETYEKYNKKYNKK